MRNENNYAHNYANYNNNKSRSLLCNRAELKIDIEGHQTNTYVYSQQTNAVCWVIKVNNLNFDIFLFKD